MDVFTRNSAPSGAPAALNLCPQTSTVPIRFSFHGLIRFVAATNNALLGVFVIRFVTPGTAMWLVAGGLAAGLLGGAVAVRKNLEA